MTIKSSKDLFFLAQKVNPLNTKHCVKYLILVEIFMLDKKIREETLFGTSAFGGFFTL